ncbi:MAG: WD40 repeat domain-containing protein [Chloroflexi bacterium]|nr:WD40 repeat domain-containing protein [Chloroflexota bacterium]
MVLRRCAVFALLIVLLAAGLARAQDSPDDPAWVRGFGYAQFHELSPDGQALIVSTTTGLYLYDTSDLTNPPLRLEGHTDTVRSAAFSADSTLAATASLDGTVHLWRLPAGEALWSARISDPCCESSPPLAPEFSPDGSLLVVHATNAYAPGPVYTFAVNTQSGEVEALGSVLAERVRDNALWTVISDEGTPVLRTLHAEGSGFVQTGQSFSDLELGMPPRALLTDHYLVILQDDGAAAVSNLDDGAAEPALDDIPTWLLSYQDTVYASDESELIAVNLATGERVDVPVQGAGWYDGGDLYLYTGPDGMLTALDLVSLESVPIAPNPAVYRIAGDRVLYADASGALQLTDLETRDVYALEDAILPEGVTDVWLHTTGDTAFLAYGTQPVTVGLWDAATGSRLTELQTYNMPYSLPSIFYQLHDESRVAMRAQTEQGDADGMLWADLSAGVLEWVPIEGYTIPLVFGPDALFYRPDRSGLARLDLASGEITLAAFEGHTTWISDLAYNAAGTRLASAGEDGAVWLWDAASGQALGMVRLDVIPLRLAFVEDSVIILDESGALHTWRDGAISSEAGDGAAYDLAARGTTLLIARDAGIDVFEVDSAADTLTLRATLVPDSDLAPVDSYRAVAIDPSGAYFAASGTAEPDDTQRAVVDLWDAESGAFVERLDGHAYSGPPDLSFSADGSQLALATGALVVWNLDETLDEPAYFAAEGTTPNNVFVGDNLVYLQQHCLANMILRRNAGGALLQTMRRTANDPNAGCGGLGYFPIAAHPDGSQIAYADPGGALVVWDLPAANVLSAPAERETPVGVVAYCDRLNGAAPIDAGEPVNVVWSWYAVDAAQVFAHLSNVTYELTLDGAPLPASEAVLGTITRDPVNDDNWTVYYTLPVGTLEPGEHTITYRATWRRAITDGLAEYGPDTPNAEDVGTCTFEVSAP